MTMFSALKHRLESSVDYNVSEKHTVSIFRAKWRCWEVEGFE
jgi:hypothetical protein